MQLFDVLHQVSDCLFQLSFGDQEISVLFQQLVILRFGRRYIVPSLWRCWGCEAVQLILFVLLLANLHWPEIEKWSPL
jgi:hypothetical protein